MTWLFFVMGAALAWGAYGPALHKGTALLGHPLRALLCVGAAYCLIAVLVPVISLTREGAWQGFTSAGVMTATAAGALGAAGAVCIIFAFKTGGTPLYVMPLVFGGAPLVNVLVSAITHPPKVAPSPLLYLGFVLAAAGAGMILYYRPVS